MNIFETQTVKARKLADNIILIEAKTGVEINRENAEVTNRIIQNEMGGDYGMILDRKQDYSIDPVNVYALLNTIEPLKAIAIILRKESGINLLSMEQRLFKGPLEAFWSIDDARLWMNEILEKIASEKK